VSSYELVARDMLEKTSPTQRERVASEYALRVSVPASCAQSLEGTLEFSLL
jgi:hypothetical protein